MNLAKEAIQEIAQTMYVLGQADGRREAIDYGVKNLKDISANDPLPQHHQSWLELRLGLESPDSWDYFEKSDGVYAIKGDDKYGPFVDEDAAREYISLPEDQKY